MGNLFILRNIFKRKKKIKEMEYCLQREEFFNEPLDDLKSIVRRAFYHFKEGNDVHNRGEIIGEGKNRGYYEETLTETMSGSYTRTDTYLSCVQVRNGVNVYISYKTYGILGDTEVVLGIRKENGIFKTKNIMYISERLFKAYDMVYTDKAFNELKYFIKEQIKGLDYLYVSDWLEKYFDDDYDNFR